ncbi:hypothetical protein EUGRSUZ_I00447 [Eucalyptus grandis]|uniref:Uncharacterized protein n=1 Tax=Eucalyptus grandis TaxID=71139 RepID=A0ACC3JBR7_EUCGR|nr:hypothetical protein EUGRSUZ_I00447 [Eucalyptus grandis]
MTLKLSNVNTATKPFLGFTSIVPESVPVAETLMGGQMGSENDQLHIFFFPLMAPGHMIPMIDMAKLFAIRGCKSTLITTPHDEPTFLKSIAKTKDSGFDIDVVTVTLPLKEVGLPEDCDNLSKVTTVEIRKQFMRATMMLDRQLELLIEKLAPNCLISDMFLPWTTEIAAKYEIPRLTFHGTGAFSFAGTVCVRLYEPHKKVSCDSEPFIIPNFPGEITMSRMQLPDLFREETDFIEFYNKVKESEERSFGVIMNSFYELEPYADHYRTFLRIRSWFVGPLSFVKSERVEEAVKRVLVREEAEKMRRKAKALAEMAKGAVEEGGSSWSDLGALLQELRLQRSAHNKI